jgi:hypothetical protein
MKEGATAQQQQNNIIININIFKYIFMIPGIFLATYTFEYYIMAYSWQCITYLYIRIIRI